MNDSALSPSKFPEINTSPTVVFAGDNTLYPFLKIWIDQLSTEANANTRYFSEAAFYYEMLFGRHSLVTFIQNHKLDITIPSIKIIDYLYGQGILTFIDLSVFGIFRKYLANYTTEFDLIKREIDLSYSYSNNPTAYQLAGDILSPTSLVLHECDLVTWENTNLRLLRQVSEQLLTNPVIWIGGDLQDPLFAQWYQLLAGQPDNFTQPQFIVQQKDISEKIIAKWIEKDVKVITSSDLVSAVAEALNLAQKEFPRFNGFGIEILKKRPYKFLDYFSESDRDFFYGREHKTKSLSANILKLPLVLLYGSSGVGKTSLLRAGLRTNLNDIGIISTYITLGARELDIIHDLRDINKSDVDQPLVVIIDQAEELFTRLNTADRELVLKEIENLLTNREATIHIVISFREDFLGGFLSWASNTPHIHFDNTRLPPLTILEARNAIENPAKKVGVIIETDLVDHILEELDNDGIMPSQLQIVCDRLYDQRDIANVIRIKHYEAAGGANGILNDYLEIALQRFNHLQKKKAQKIMSSLITSLGWRTQRNFHEIQQKTNFPKQELEILLSDLVDSRLVRSLERAGNQLYELSHDTLATHIQEWINIGRQRALEVTQLLPPSTGKHLSVDLDISKEKLYQISSELNNPHLQLSREQVQYLLQASLVYGVAVSEWVRRNVEMSIDVWAILSPLLSSKDERLRKHAVIGLAGMLGPRAIEHLSISMHDSSPRVRFATHQVLYAFSTPEALSLLDKSEYLRLVPAGSFTMGRPQGLRYAIKEYVINQKINFPGVWMLAWNESPVHDVDLPAFFAGRTPISKSEYMDFIQSDGYQNPSYWTKAGWSWRVANNRERPDLWNDERYDDPDFPVVGITWFEAVAYAHWAECRLLSEAEWEKAGRSTDERHFPWGNKFDKSLCNTREGGIGGLSRVGMFSPHGDSPYGIADLSGNVWEWTNSVYKPYPYNPHDGREDMEEGELRVPRGGSWTWRKNNVRLVCRGSDAPEYSSQNLGFRIGANAEFGENIRGKLG